MPETRIQKEKSYLSDVLDYEHDIAPNPLTVLYAGVGSGKNTFVSKLMNGDPDRGIPKKTVLLITSRLSKVRETLGDQELDISKAIGNCNTLNEIWGIPEDEVEQYSFEQETAEGFKTIFQRSSVKTNAFIEAYQRYRHRADDPVTHIWNRFDVIVWDECHSLTVDSTYQSAPFYVQRLMEETFSRIMAARKNEELPETERNPGIKPPRCKNIILMTGTPEPLSKVRLPVEASILDLRDQCRVVQPQNIHFVEKAQAEEQIKEQQQAGERVLYFSNHIVPAAELAERYGIARERVVMSFSDEIRRQTLKETDTAEGNEDTGDYHRLISVQEYLEKHSRIHEDIALFVTTSKNKEGININDDDIRHVYIESHSMTDICQMAGRLRHGAENVYIILDSQGHPPGESRFDAFFADRMCQYKLEGSNQPPMQVHLLDDMLQEVRRRAEWKAQVSSPAAAPCAFVDELPDVKAFIDYVLSKTPYLMYDYFTGTFKANVYRKLGNNHMNEELTDFGEAKADPDKLVQLFQRYFPASEVHRPCDRTEQALEYLNAYLEEHPANCLSGQELAELVDHLANILNYQSGDNGIKPNKILHLLGYHTDRLSHKKEHPGYQNFKIVTRP